MTRKEKKDMIIDLVAKYYMLPIKSMKEISRMDDWCEDLADAILSLPIEVPSEEEIKTEANKVEYRNIPTYDTQRVTFKIAAKWAINEILKRNGKDNS